MLNAVYIGFDFGYKRIGVAVGQLLTRSASPLSTLAAKAGVPDWQKVKLLIKEWQPRAFVVGVPTCIDGSSLYTTEAARQFAQQLKNQFNLPVHMVDERLSTVEARAYLFDQGGYNQIQNTEIDGIAACIILEQWLRGFPLKEDSK